MYAGMTIEEFLERLSSKKPTPGGGSGAALAGAVAAALLSMVAKISGDKKIAQKSERLRKVLTELIDKDAKAFERVIKEKSSEEALKEATEIPLQIARYSYEVLKLAESLVRKVKHSVVSDVGVAVRLAEAAVEGALLNVKINLNSVKDEEFKKEIKKPIEKELYLAGYQARTVISQIPEKLNKKACRTD